MANSLLEMDKNRLKLIRSANFVHPNTSPLYSITVMDWATSHLERILDEDEYLYGDPEIAFERLMKPVGNSDI